MDRFGHECGPHSLLGRFGAEVIKVEGVQRPDAMRFTSAKSPTEEGWWEWSTFYQANNFNKRDLTLDLTLPRGRDLLLELVGVSDVLIENFAPRVLDAYGINWETVHATNPHAVMVRMPAFGLDGPWRNRVGFAQTMEQISGLAWVTGYTDGPPIIPGGPCDPVAGMHAAFALLCALEERDRSGIGQFVEVAMVEAALNIAAETVIELSAYGATLSRNANRGPGAAPQGIYGCRGTEQWLALAVDNNEQWRRLVGILGHPEWAQAIELATAAGRHAAHDLVDQQLSSMFSLRELHELVDTLAASGVPAAAVTGPAAVLANPQLVARGFIESVDSPTVGHHELFGLPFRLATRPGPWITRPAPSLGQDNQNILRTLLGLSDAEVSNLRHDKVTATVPVSAECPSVLNGALTPSESLSSCATTTLRFSATGDHARRASWSIDRARPRVSGRALTIQSFRRHTCKERGKPLPSPRPARRSRPVGREGAQRFPPSPPLSLGPTD